MCVDSSKLAIFSKEGSIGPTNVSFVFPEHSTITSVAPSSISRILLESAKYLVNLSSSGHEESLLLD